MTDAELEERRTFTWNGKKHEVAAAHMSDIEVACEVRMLMRDQLNHEAVCCTARDRIVCLHEEKQVLISTIRELREENAQTKLGYGADIQALCEALWKREPGCEFVRLNYPQIAAALEEQS